VLKNLWTALTSFTPPKMIPFNSFYENTYILETEFNDFLLVSEHRRRNILVSYPGSIIDNCLSYIKNKKLENRIFRGDH
jgi:hypothetical protein